MLFNIVIQFIFYEKNAKSLVWYIKNSSDILNKLKPKGFLASSLSSYDFPILNTSRTSPHNLISEILTESIEHNTDH